MVFDVNETFDNCRLGPIKNSIIENIKFYVLTSLPWTWWNIPHHNWLMVYIHIFIYHLNEKKIYFSILYKNYNVQSNQFFCTVRLHCECIHAQLRMFITLQMVNIKITKQIFAEMTLNLNLSLSLSKTNWKLWWKRGEKFLNRSSRNMERWQWIWTAGVTSGENI